MGGKYNINVLFLIIVNGKQQDVYKSPIDDPGKISKKGKLKLVSYFSWKDNKVGPELITVGIDDPRIDVLVEVYRNGKILINPTFDQIRERSKF